MILSESQATASFAALSDSTRLGILRHLITKGPAGDSAGAIAGALDVQASRLSFHLTKLAQAGLVSSQRQGRQITYRASFEHMGALLSFLLEDCCQNAPQVRQCCGL